MHQAQWSPERPLPPPVSLTSQSHHEKPPEEMSEAINMHDEGAQPLAEIACPLPQSSLPEEVC